ncbi:phosphoribosylanthranilate isomerase [Paenalcaligenes hermetiae]|uniref:N-(5'-phosphoribosyl)anthranilate isomerase n=1 Tax=Paenalcaligenes hermetiae TaxID=1157987 RepID=A0ABP9MAF0_9BURK
MRTRVKMCGFTRIEDIDAAVQAGADALGFVFYPKSQRYLRPEQARLLAQHVPAFVQTVALFVNPTPAFVQTVIQQMQPDLLQFHGEESVAFCESFAYPYIRAFRVGAPDLDTPTKIVQHCRRYASAKGWLFDSYTSAYGGSGVRFDDDLLEALHAQHRPQDPPLILAGGIRHHNVLAQIQRHHPFAVDVSSAIEDAPGIKNAEKIQQFMRIMNQSPFQQSDE